MFEKRTRTAFYVLIGAVIIYSCTFKVNPVMYVNKTDPDNPYYADPQAVLFLPFSDGDTIGYNTFLASWNGAADEGDGSNFRWVIDDTLFTSGWTERRSEQIPMLAEGAHLISLEEKYPNGIRQKKPTQRRFVVDAIHGPAVTLSPPYQILDEGQTLLLEIWLEEVTDLSGGRIIVNWDHTQAALNSYYFYNSVTDFLHLNNSSIIHNVTLYADSLILETGLVDNQGSGISGSGKILQMQFLAAAEADEILFEVSHNTELRNHLNQSIPLDTLTQARAVKSNN
jgi:hypothetical protein